MNRKALILTGILATLLFCSQAFASCSMTFPYSQVNSTDATVKATDQDYTSWRVKVYNGLTYNATSNTYCIIKMQNHTTTNMTFGINVELWMWKSTAFQIWTDALIVDESDFNGLSAWDSSDPVVITYRSSHLFVGNLTDYDCYLANFYIADLTLRAVSSRGYNTTVATSGYVTAEVTSSTSDPSTMNESIMSYMPIIIQFAMLGVVMGMLKKFGKI